jgi:hypothetical protein
MLPVEARSSRERTSVPSGPLTVPVASILAFNQR